MEVIWETNGEYDVLALYTDDGSKIVELFEDEAEAVFAKLAETRPTKPAKTKTLKVGDIVEDDDYKLLKPGTILRPTWSGTLGLPIMIAEKRYFTSHGKNSSSITLFSPREILYLP